MEGKYVQSQRNKNYLTCRYPNSCHTPKIRVRMMRQCNEWQNHLKSLGLVKNSIVVDEDMVLITGHTTTKAMQALGWEECP